MGNKKKFSREVVIEVFRGPDRVFASKFDEGPVVIGRQPDCDVILNYSFISRTHAHLMEEQGEFYFVDLGGRNPFFQDGHIVDRIPVLGNSEFVLEDVRVHIRVVQSSVPRKMGLQDEIETVVFQNPRKQNK